MTSFVNNNNSLFYKLFEYKRDNILKIKISKLDQKQRKIVIQALKDLSNPETNLHISNSTLESLKDQFTKTNKKNAITKIFNKLLNLFRPKVSSKQVIHEFNQSMTIVSNLKTDSINSREINTKVNALWKMHEDNLIIQNIINVSFSKMNPSTEFIEFVNNAHVKKLIRFQELLNLSDLINGKISNLVNGKISNTGKNVLFSDVNVATFYDKKEEPALLNAVDEFVNLAGEITNHNITPGI